MKAFFKYRNLQYSPNDLSTPDLMKAIKFFCLTWIENGYYN